MESLEDIFNNIKEDSPVNARYVRDSLLSLARSLNDFPEKYSIEPYLADHPNNYRSVSKWSYKMIYEVTSEAIIIVMLFDGRQDPDKIPKLIDD